MAAEYIDAHVHLHDARLRGYKSCWDPRESAGIHLVNGTGPEDWEAVARLDAAGEGFVLKAYGVHPWEAGPQLPGDWEKRLRGYLEGGAVSVGEIGLDRWVEPRDDAKQEAVFGRQLELAREYRLPPTLHCLRAWDRLVAMVKEAGIPEPGFLVHGFGGSGEVQRQLVEMGGHFSFSAYALAPRRKRMQAAVRACPADRLLVETDAPDMVPDEEVVPALEGEEDGERLHDPRAIRVAYAGLARMRGEEPGPMREQVAENFRRLFGSPQRIAS